MPELPEVETVVRSLRPQVVGWTLGAAQTGPHRLRAPLDQRALAALAGRPVVGIERLGKYLLFRLGDDAPLILSHLGMTGRYAIAAPDAPLEPHTHLRVALSRPGEPPRQLRYSDPRRFGLVVVRPPGALPEELRDLGPDPLGDAFTPAGLYESLHGTERPLKSALLDQALVAGLGNIYVAEALHRAGLRPTRRASTVSRAAAASLHQAIRDILLAAVERRGTTLSDGGYVDAEGRAGDNAAHLAVYAREGQPCPRCSGTVRRIVQAQRSTFYCPGCQR